MNLKSFFVSLQTSSSRKKQTIVLLFCVCYFFFITMLTRFIRIDIFIELSRDLRFDNMKDTKNILFITNIISFFLLMFLLTNKSKYYQPRTTVINLQACKQLATTNIKLFKPIYIINNNFLC